MNSAQGAETLQAIGASTVEEIRHAYEPTVLIASGSDFTETVEMYGQFLTFAPRGIERARPVYDYPWVQSSAGKRIRNWEKKEQIVSAEDVAAAICSPDHYGKKGFVVLLGDGHDEERKLHARRTWVAWYEDYCRSQEARWVSRITAFRAANPGGMLPSQPKTVRHCQEWLNRLEKGLVDTGGAREEVKPEVQCGYCSAPFLDEAAALAHVKARHPGAADDAEAIVYPGRRDREMRAEAERRDPAPAKAAAGQPASDIDGATAFLLRRAKALGVPVDAAEYEGLILGDRDVIDGLTHKIAEAAAAAEPKTRGPRKDRAKKRG